MSDETSFESGSDGQDGANFAVPSAPATTGLETESVPSRTRPRIGKRAVGDRDAIGERPRRRRGRA